MVCASVVAALAFAVRDSLSDSRVGDVRICPLRKCLTNMESYESCFNFSEEHWHVVRFRLEGYDSSSNISTARMWSQVNHQKATVCSEARVRNLALTGDGACLLETRRCL